ncbi:EI24 domain-containing protein [Actinotalea sp. JY-7885]|uniref:EI24 domain-containing protein n=1 Tax=Actinotalea sp. JY-7885 TaxID=2758576 RepID=UPI00165E4449|nr:EI24 domain-containing protein [Actinotalea sp. JY-7885]
MREFVDGARLLLRGWGFWRRRPSAMAWGLVPAALAGVLVLTLFVVLVLNLERIGDALTGFADGWGDPWRQMVELAAQAVVLGAAVVLAVVSFTGLTLAVGEPFYDRIWRAVEQTETGTVPAGDTGFWRGAVDGLAMVGRGLVVAVIAGAIGFIPVVGTVLGWVAGVVLTGWVLAHELTTRALVARGIERRERNRLLRANRVRAVGFGAATQLCFLVPGGAVATMPAAVAGSTLLAHSLLAGTPLRVVEVPEARRAQAGGDGLAG